MASELSTRRRVLFTTLVATFVLISIELMCQLFYRATAGEFLFRHFEAPVFDPDSTRCYRLKPNLRFQHRTSEFDVLIYTNSEGMRTDASRSDVAPEKPAGVYRILFLGPSFTFGWGSRFEEAYPTLVGELLRRDGMPVEIINLGTPAQDVEPQLCWLERVGWRYQPDMVVQTLYGRRVEAIAGECPEHLHCPVVENSKVYSEAPTLGRKLFSRLKASGVVFYGTYAYQWALDAFPSEELGTGKELHEPRAVEREDGFEGFASNFTRYEQTIHRILGERAEVVFVFIPLSFVVHPEDAPRWRHLRGADLQSSRVGIRADVDALRRSGHKIVDASEALIPRGDEERLYYWLDIHLTPAGNRVVAEALVPVLRERIEGAGSVPATANAASSAIQPATAASETK
jgi:hypothetical protein